MGIETLIVAAVLGTASVIESRKARKSQEKAAKAQERGRQLAARQQAIEGARDAQIARARATAQGVNQGLEDSSVLEGAVSSIESTASGNFSFLDQLESFNRAAFRHTKDANRHAGQSADLGAFASFVSARSGRPSHDPSKVEVVEKSTQA